MAKQLQRSWSRIFRHKNSQKSKLCELLGNYSKNGVSQKTPTTLDFDHPDLAVAIDYLYIDSFEHLHEDLMEALCKNRYTEVTLQFAIRRLVVTEMEYIISLRVIIDFFLPSLEALQKEGLLKEVDQHLLFGNIRDIYKVNLNLWIFYLYPMVDENILTRKPYKVTYLLQGFIAFVNMFGPYKKYCAERSICEFYCEELKRTNSLFKSYWAWCESEMMHYSVHLADVLTKPMQRLTEYTSLLESIKECMIDVDDIQAIDVILKLKTLTYLDGFETKLDLFSSKYFLISFCTKTNYQDFWQEFFTATRSVSLLNAICHALRRNRLSFNQLTIIDCTDNGQAAALLKAGFSSLETSLDEHTEVDNLVGHHLLVMNKSSSRETLLKALSFVSRNRPTCLIASPSTGVNLMDISDVKKSKSQLCGIPQETVATLSLKHPHLVNACHYLGNRHNSWMDIVEYNSMNDMEIRRQSAIWELVTTEMDYINALRTVIEIYLPRLKSLQEEDFSVVVNIDKSRLFANICEIYESNLRFWLCYLYPMVQHSLNTRDFLRVEFFYYGFLTIDNIFAPYKVYCTKLSNCQLYCKELSRTNSLFTSYLADCEKKCNRLRLADLLIKPMQRLTRYSLLLKAIEKYLINEDEIEAITTMLCNTEDFVLSINNSMA